MSETLNLDKLEQLLEQMEPAEIRAVYGEALALDPGCARMLESFENMDAHMDALKTATPQRSAPPLAAPRLVAPIAPSIPSAKAKPKYYGLHWALPLAAMILVGIFLTYPIQDTLPQAEDRIFVPTETTAAAANPASGEDDDMEETTPQAGPVSLNESETSETTSQLQAETPAARARDERADSPKPSAVLEKVKAPNKKSAPASSPARKTKSEGNINKSVPKKEQTDPQTSDRSAEQSRQQLKQQEPPRQEPPRQPAEAYSGQKDSSETPGKTQVAQELSEQLSEQLSDSPEDRAPQLSAASPAAPITENKLAENAGASRSSADAQAVTTETVQGNYSEGFLSRGKEQRAADERTKKQVKAWLNRYSSLTKKGSLLENSKLFAPGATVELEQIAKTATWPKLTLDKGDESPWHLIAHDMNGTEVGHYLLILDQQGRCTELRRQ